MKKNGTLAASVLIVIALFLLAFPPQGESQSFPPPTIYVTCPPPPESPWQTLQYAVNMAGSGTTIYVTGTCNENIEFYSPKFYITLDGRGTAVIKGDPSRPTVLVGGDNITIKGLAITGGQAGLVVYRNGYAIIDGNTIEFTGGYGIGLENSATARIVNNTIQNNPGDGIIISQNSSARIGIIYPFDSVPKPNTIEHNDGNGITVVQSSSALIVGNTVGQNGGDGIRVARVSQADISDNTIDGNNGNGILVTQNSGVNLGNDTGDTILDLPNITTVGNGLFGLKGTIGGYADGRLGTLDGLMGRAFFDLRSINSTKPWVW